MKLTAASIARLQLPAGKLDHIEFDDDIPGFGIRLRDGGSRTWIFQYKLGTKQRRLVLGKVSAIKPERAREDAGDLHAKVRLGGDPAADKAVNKVRAANNFGELARRYLEFQEGELRPRSYAEVRRHLGFAEVKPHHRKSKSSYAKPLHALPITSIDRRSIADRLNVIAKESGAVTANRTRASLSAMFGWAMREGLADGNPVMDTGKREEKSRDRVLSDAELKIIWNSLEEDHYGAIIKLLMLTGQRANEMAGLRWPEIDLEHGLISLPGERTKNARAHQVPMSSAVRSILKEHPKTEKRQLLFGYGDGPFSGWSKSKEALDERILKATKKALPHWTPHDLRRTTATRMADLGIQPHVIEAVLNHVSGHKGGIAGVYNRAIYAAEKRQALEIWADHIAAVLADRKSNVTSLRRPA
jgi:integrase